MATEPLRAGIDIGGTFTDLVMLDTRNGKLFNEKVLTTPQDPSIGALEGLEKILRCNRAEPNEVQHIIHGTTLVANAIIERRGASVALITTAGFKDILEIGTEWRYDTYDLFMEMPRPLVPRHLRFEVPERIGPDGNELQTLDEDAVRATVRQIASAGVEAVAVSLLHGFRNPAHEQRVRNILEQEAPELVVCLSSEVMPAIGEYERTYTTVCNAYVLPVFEQYLNRLTAGLRGMGIDKDLFLMLSDGGTVHESTAVSCPIRLVQSGPAGGVQAASMIGRLAGESDILCFDMGGTTAKACLVDEGQPLRTMEFEVARVYRFRKGSGIPLRVPVIEMIETGAGGGSIATVDHLGLVRVGPESSGADPGPACYARGGRDATVTDADLVLGYLSARNFLGGDMQLDIASATDALTRNVAEPLGVSAIDAAWAVHETVNENMAQAATIHALETARNASGYAMVPIGGAGPVHACNIAMKMSLARVVCPLSAGVASAFGFLVSPTSFTFVQGGVTALGDLDFGMTGAMLTDMERDGRELLAASGVEDENVAVEFLAAMRYLGQGYDVEASISKTMLEACDRPAIRSAFEQAYKTQFGRVEEHMPVEIVSWRVIATGPRPQVEMAAAGSNSRQGAALKGRRNVYFGPDRRFVDVAVYDRYGLSPGDNFEGPCIFEERESTTVVPPQGQVSVDSGLNLIVDLPASHFGGAD